MAEERDCQCSNTENRVKVVEVVFFNVRDKGGNLGEFFFGGGGGGCSLIPREYNA